MSKCGITHLRAIQCIHRNMRAAIFSLATFSIVLSAGFLLSQNPPDSILLDVGAIEPKLTFTVTDEKGLSVPDLFQYDFELFDNGEPRRIDHFARVKTPYSVVVLLDCSDSTRPRANLLVSTTARFGDHLRSDDKFVFAAFGTEVKTYLDWNDEKKPFSIPDSPICHGTNFYAALDWAEKKVRGMPGRHGIVAFTDGQESDVARKEVTVNGLKVRRVVPPEDDREFQKILKTARASKAQFYFVAVDTDLNPGSEYAGPVADLQQIRARMELLATSTGGRIVFPNTPGDTGDLFRDIRQDLGIAYSLDFVPTKSKDGTPRKIEIRVKGEDHYQVHQSRDSYLVN
jgi:VWFA-related protein